MEGISSSNYKGFLYDGNSSTKRLLQNLFRGGFTKTENIEYLDGTQRTCTQKQVVVYATEYGLGLKAAELIQPNTRILIYAGKEIRMEEADKLKEDHLGEYLLNLDETFIDARALGSYARFVNHHCQPNSCYETYSDNGKQVACIVSMKEIQIGEPVTCSYIDDTQPKKDRYSSTYIPTCQCTAEKHKDFGPALQPRNPQPRIGGRFAGKSTNQLNTGRFGQR
jgi:hypothetical protein